jgi:DNA-directed RNA polymerase II subunit RPB3
MLPTCIAHQTNSLPLPRPKSKNAEWEDPPADGAPFNYDAQPTSFFFEVESIGNLEPDAVIQQGIKAMQQKLAAVIQELAGDPDRAAAGGGAVFGEANAFGEEYEPRSPDVTGNGDYSMGGTEGYTSAFGAADGAGSAWGGAGGATPYGSTPYGGGEDVAWGGS